jgi:hypothetical protein
LCSEKNYVQSGIRPNKLDKSGTWNHKSPQIGRKRLAKWDKKYSNKNKNNSLNASI